LLPVDHSRLFLRKDNGLVRDVIRTRHMRNLHGDIGIGHVRYPTAGSADSAEAQPFYVNSPFGITLAHNGNLTNAAQLKDELFRADLRHINTRSDSEILLNVFAHELQQRSRLAVDADDIFAAVAAVHRRVRGAYAAVVLIVGVGLVAFRDPHGIRPLVFGSRETDSGMEYMAASESVALDALDFERIRDVAPGEAVLFDMQGRIAHPPVRRASVLFALHLSSSSIWPGPIRSWIRFRYIRPGCGWANIWLTKFCGSGRIRTLTW
jgi:amidophosphoribosyltransferase